MRVSRLEEGRSTRRSFASSRNTLSRLNEGDEAMRRRTTKEAPRLRRLRGRAPPSAASRRLLAVGYYVFDE